ncbi:MAG: SRPBCC family protein [Elainella sp. Prado103]|nr:SRPBCC family protein [Elainella sp. Prado103]
MTYPNRLTDMDADMQEEMEFLAEELDQVSLDDQHNVVVSTDRAEGRERQISARIHLPYSVEQVWQILTDYDRLADFIPNLSTSKRIEHPTGGIRIEQVGTQALLRFKFCARVVLDMVEQFPHQIGFTMVEGDFKSFRGCWSLQSIDNTEAIGTELCYTVSILPPRTMPVGLIERKLKNGLVLNMTAIRQRADQLFKI